MLRCRKFKETNTALTLTLTNTGDLRTIEPSDYRAATAEDICLVAAAVRSDCFFLVQFTNTLIIIIIIIIGGEGGS